MMSTPTVLAAATSVHWTEQVVFYTFLQVIAILAAARAAGTVAGWLKQPRVVGEIIGSPDPAKCRLTTPRATASMRRFRVDRLHTNQRSTPYIN
jgi:hypothetical protein